MALRYVTLRSPPRAWDSDGPMAERPTMTVHEAVPAPQPTGLLDAHGAPLYRIEERNPIGFCLSKGARE
mgnify:FL=1